MRGHMVKPDPRIQPSAMSAEALQDAINWYDSEQWTARSDGDRRRELEAKVELAIFKAELDRRRRGGAVGMIARSFGGAASGRSTGRATDPRVTAATYDGLCRAHRQVRSLLEARRASARLMGLDEIEAMSVEEMEKMLERLKIMEKLAEALGKWNQAIKWQAEAKAIEKDKQEFASQGKGRG
jgi:hypothetical protein